MRILHVEAGRHLYGGALQVAYLVRGLAGQGHENILVCPSGSAIAGAVHADGVVVREVSMGGDTDVFLIPRLVRIIREERPEIVHLHSRRGADVLGGLAAWKAGVPAVVTRRVDNPEPAWWARRKYRLYRRVIAISEAIRHVLVSEGVPAEQVVCVHSAVDTRVYSPGTDRDRLNEEFGLPKSALAVAMVAQFIERKGHRQLIDAVAAVADKVPEVKVLLFGKGPLQESLRETVASRGLSKTILFPGFRSDLERILPCLDVVVHPATMEGLGVALLQASACGVPIIAARAGGVPEIVRHGENGLLVGPGSAHDIGDALRKLLQDSALRLALGARGREIVEREFSIPAMVEGNLGVYRQILSIAG